MKKRPNLRKIARYALFAVIGLAIVGACAYGSFWILFLRDPSLEDIEEEINIDLPESATNVEYSHSRWIETNVYLRFTLPRDDLQGLLEQFCPDDDVLEDGYVSRYVDSQASDNPEWWSPDIEAMTAFSGGDCRFVVEQLHTYSILVDESGAEIVEVFLYASIETVNN